MSDPVAPLQSGEDGNLYANGPLSMLPVANGMLITNLATGVTVTLESELAAVINHCGIYRTMREHAEYLVSIMPEMGGEIEKLIPILTAVKDAGIMMSAQEVCDRVNTVSPAAAPVLAPTSVFIITCDRPVALERLLESMLHNASLSGHHEVVVVDDSRDAANAEKNRELVERFVSTTPTKGSYFGAAEQSQMLHQLVAAQPENESAMRFLLDRTRWSNYKSYGLARSWCLLLSVGNRCIVMDDDVLCSALLAPVPQSGLGFTNGMRDAAFYAEARQWQNAAKPAGFDPLVGHASCLGMHLADAVQALGDQPLSQEHLKGASAVLFGELQADSPVLVTQCGTFGDPGTTGNSWIPNLEAETIQQMLQSPGGLASALANRQCWLGQSSPCFSKRASMSQIIGLDNSQVLPPYFPVFRGEDQLFGSMLEFLYPHSVALEYPWAIPHIPQTPRQGNPAGDSTVAQASLQLCASFLTENPPVAGEVSFETRMELLSLRLQEAAECETPSIEAKYSALLARARAFAAQKANDRLHETANMSSEWDAYLTRSLNDNLTALEGKQDLAAIAGLPTGMSSEAVALQVKGLAGEFAAAVRAWPAIREAAKAHLAQSI